MSIDSKDWGYEAHNINVASKEIRKRTIMLNLKWKYQCKPIITTWKCQCKLSSPEVLRVTWDVYKATPPPKARGILQKRGQEDCTS